MLDSEPLGPVEARQLVRQILKSLDGRVLFTGHAKPERMKERGIAENKVSGCLTGVFCGSNTTYEEGELALPDGDARPGGRSGVR